jgi:hypothetical protein
MHPLILGVALLAGSALAASTHAACPRPGAAVVEQFIPAACADCWAANAPVPAAAWRLDWIVPGADDAPLAVAALADATERLQRLGQAQPAATATHSQPARTLPGLRLKVASGPAWQGYFGAQLTLPGTDRARLPAGAIGWLALVETLPPGSESNSGPRELVRSVAGPLPLDIGDPPRAGRGTAAISHLRSLRWPAGAKPERLHARGWIEAADGRLLAMAASRCP